jgi:hypothetical protein
MGSEMKTACPNEERLADYLEGRLSEEDRYIVEKHLSECDICLEGLVVTNSLVRGRGRFDPNPVPDDVTEAAVRLVTSLSATTPRSLMEKLKGSIKNISSAISDDLRPSPWQRWQPSPVRASKTVASGDIVCLRVSFKEIETGIEIEKTGSGMARIRVTPREAEKHRKALRMTLKKAEREVASYLLDGDYVLFEDIPFGHYSISLAKKGVQLGTYLFEVKETPHARR